MYAFYLTANYFQRPILDSLIFLGDREDDRPSIIKSSFDLLLFNVDLGSSEADLRSRIESFDLKIMFASNLNLLCGYVSPS